ncbi:MAG: DUF3667 domain-containing protein [Bacteroidota bacterium]
METEVRKCKNCQSVLHGPYCSVCGQKWIDERLTVKRVLSSAISNIFNLEKGLWYTVKMLFISPGQVVRDYVNGRTQPYFPPFRYALIFIALAAFANLGLGVYDSQMDQIIDQCKKIGMYSTPEDEAQGREIMKFMTNFLNFIPFLLLPFLSLSSYVLFKREKWYYAEHMALNTFLLGHVSLLGIFNTLLVYFVPAVLPFFFFLSTAIYILVYGLCYRQLFKRNLFEGFFLGFFTYLLAFVFFFLTVGVLSFVLGFAVAMIMKSFD